ncbi:MAG: hypothetical protein ABMA64_32495, partial [Myxococcota bacterium]
VAVPLLTGASGMALGMGGAGIALLPAVGLEPRDTVIPQLAALSGATLGALGAALATDEGSRVALGSLIGSTVGFGAGAATVALVERDRRAVSVPGVRLPGTWLPVFGPQLGPGGTRVQATGW